MTLELARHIDSLVQHFALTKARTTEQRMTKSGLRGGTAELNEQE